MITEADFQILQALQQAPFLKRPDYSSDDEFDHVCEIARSLMNDGWLHSKNSEPFMRNNTGQGCKYSIAGKFELSAEALGIVQFKDYRSYVISLPKKSKWNLDRRLVVFGIICALLAIIVGLVVEQKQ